MCLMVSSDASMCVLFQVLEDTNYYFSNNSPLDLPSTAIGSSSWNPKNSGLRKFPDNKSEYFSNNPSEELDYPAEMKTTESSDFQFGGIISSLLQENNEPASRHLHSLVPSDNNSVASSGNSQRPFSSDHPSPRNRLEGKPCTKVVSSRKGLNPRPCPVCGKLFCYKSEFLRHVRTHTGEKPFKCPFCSFSSAQTSNLNAHIKGIHKEHYMKNP